MISTISIIKALTRTDTRGCITQWPTQLMIHCLKNEKVTLANAPLRPTVAAAPPPTMAPQAAHTKPMEGHRLRRYAMTPGPLNLSRKSTAMSPITALLYISINKLPGICAKLQPRRFSYHALNHQLRRPSHDTVTRVCSGECLDY